MIVFMRGISKLMSEYVLRYANNLRPVQLSRCKTPLRCMFEDVKS